MLIDFLENILFFLLFFVFLLSLCCVYSENIDDNVTLYDSRNGICDECYQISEYDDNELLSKTFSLNGGKFSDIQKLINNANNGDTIKLSGLFKSDGNQITVNKKLTITSSSGATLDGNSKTRVFNINFNAKGSLISNIVFKNAYSESRGGAIYLNAENVHIDNCSFHEGHCLFRWSYFHSVKYY